MLHLHSEIESDPSSDAEKVGQSKQMGLPNSSLYVLRGQSLSSPSTQKVPGGHGRQTPTLTEGSMRCPSGHGAGGGVGGKMPSL